MATKQRELFEYEFRMEKLSKVGDPLERIANVVPWNTLFQTPISRAFKKIHKGPGGRPPYDYILMFKVLIIQAFYNLSDEQLEFQLNDRLSFQRFIGVTISETTPDAKTIWLFRDTLVKANVFDKLFKKFNEYLDREGIVARKGSVVDASFVEVPRANNSREENEQIKEGNVPDDWSDAKRAQKDTDARWAKKNNEKHFGYKNHIKIDNKSKIITRSIFTPANAHDSTALSELLDEEDARHELYADSAYRSKAIEAELKEKGIRSRIHKKGKRGHPLPEKDKEVNKRKSKKRARVEHVFGFLASMRAGFIRCIGAARAASAICFRNLVYNIRRYEYLIRT